MEKMLVIFRRLKLRVATWKIHRKDKRLKKIAPISTILSTYPTKLKPKKHRNLCLYAHFDANGKISDYVRHQCMEFEKNDFDVVIISTSSLLNTSDIDNTLPDVRGIIHRRNIGYDFVSWRVALDCLQDIQEYDSLLLTNDSIFGPFSSLKTIFDRINSSSAQVNGLTDNWEKCYHLQSYFLHFKNPVFHSRIFRDFWDGVRIRADKEVIIISYEVGLSQHLLKHGFTLKALFPFHEVRAKYLEKGRESQYRERLLRQPVNSTIFMWETLVKDFHFPYIKTELLKTNRFLSTSVPFWRDLIPSEHQNIADKCVDHLKIGHENCRV